MDDNKSVNVVKETSETPIISHIKELRNRLIYSFGALLIGFFVCFAFADNIFNFLTAPLMDAFGENSGRRLIYTSLPEKFFTNIKLAFFASFMLTFPIIASQVWMFIAPGLYKNEKKMFLPFLIFTPLLFALGASFVYTFILPMAWEFFIGFEQAGSTSILPVQLESKVDEYLSLVMQLIFAFGFAFELPVVVTLLSAIGVTSSAGLREKRRYAILGAFVAAAILTPPDPLSQIGLAIPIIILYEISIYTSMLVEQKSTKSDII